MRGELHQSIVEDLARSGSEVLNFYKRLAWSMTKRENPDLPEFFNTSGGIASVFRRKSESSLWRYGNGDVLSPDDPDWINFPDEVSTEMMRFWDIYEDLRGGRNPLPDAFVIERDLDVPKLTIQEVVVSHDLKPDKWLGLYAVLDSECWEMVIEVHSHHGSISTYSDADMMDRWLASVAEGIEESSRLRAPNKSRRPAGGGVRSPESCIAPARP